LNFGVSSLILSCVVLRILISLPIIIVLPVICALLVNSVLPAAFLLIVHQPLKSINIFTFEPGVKLMTENLHDDIIRRIVAMSKWWFPYTLTPEQEAAGVGSNKLPRTYPEGAVSALANEYFGDLFEKRKKYIHHETQYCMFSRH